MSDKQWKSCSGPFWAECHADMEKQEARIRELEAACRVMAKAIAADTAWFNMTEGGTEASISANLHARRMRENAMSDPTAAKFLEEARNG